MSKPRPRADRTRYERERRQGIRRTTTATQAIEHLSILRSEGRTWAELEQVMGYDLGHLKNVASGRYARISREMSEDILSVRPSPPEHTNWRACDCAPCRFRVRAYNRQKMRDYRATSSPLLTDPAHALAHVRALQAQGWTLKDIAARAGYSKDTLVSMSSGRRKRIGMETERDILSIPLEVAA